MNMASKLARIAVVLFSLTLLVAYVRHVHVTPNTPPPDPLGLNAVEFEGFIDHVSPTPSGERPASDLRIISSKVINQPVFSVRRTTAAQASQAVEAPGMFIRPIMPGTKSAPVGSIFAYRWRLLGFREYDVELIPFPGLWPKPTAPTPFPSWNAKVDSATVNRTLDPFVPNNTAADPFVLLPESPPNSP
jgi:hypothetical protein